VSKKAKTMRAARPGRASGKAVAAWWEGRRPGVDFLKARLLKLCDQAGAAVRMLRKMNLESEETAEMFSTAASELMDVAFYVQGIEDALGVRQKARQAALELATLEDGDPNGAAFGLGAKMYREMARYAAGAAKVCTSKARWVA